MLGKHAQYGQQSRQAPRQQVISYSPNHPMSAVLKSTGARFEPFRMDCLQRLPAVLAVEQSAYAHPWSQANFMDALRSGYQSQLLLAIQNV